MVERFFSAPQTDLHHSQSAPILLLSGPPSSGKTSLLFQFAFNSALETHSSVSNNGKVVFLCNRRRLESKPPYLSQGIDPSSDIFHRIQMKYVDDDEGINKFFAAFHLHDKFPHTVIIDDFGDLFDERNCQQRYNNPRGRDLAMVRILALLKPGHARFYSLIHTMATLQGCSLFTRDGSLPFIQLKVMALGRFFLRTTSILEAPCHRG
ncbi:hypothetical protein CsSME_00021549 [Camellia sinensis var. sinensis]